MPTNQKQSNRKARIKTVALYSASVKPVSRSRGRSATAAAAYRNAERITDERTGEVHDYTRRSGVDHVALFSPAGMVPPASADLWNKAEAAEVRKNARVAREVLVALPHELDQVQRCELATSIAQDLADRYGTAGTLAVHLPDREGDNRNHHAHILMTTRRLEASGQLGEKTRELDDVKRGPLEVEWIREMIERQTNHSLERAGSTERVDRRSLVEQHAAALDTGDTERAEALDRPATLHEGPRITQIRREAARAGRAPLGEQDRAAANDHTRQLQADRAQLASVSAQILDFEKARALRDARAQEAPKLTGSVKAESEPSDGPAVLGMRERFAALMQLQSGKPAVQPEPPPAVVPAAPEPEHQVQPVERLPGESGLEARIRKMKEDVAEAAKKPGFSLLLASLEAAKPEPKAAPAIEPVHEVKPVTKLPSANQVELEGLKAGLVPVAKLVAADPKVIEAKKELARQLAREAEAKARLVAIPKQVAEWRAEHPWRATLHDKGVKKSPELERAEQSLRGAQTTLRNASGAQRMHEEDLSRAERRASDMVYQERRPISARIDELETVVRRETAAERQSEQPEQDRATKGRSEPVRSSEAPVRRPVERDEPGMEM